MPSLAELTDAYYQDPVPQALPVEQPYLGVPISPDGMRRVYISTPANETDLTRPITDTRPEPRPEPGLDENPLEVWAKKKSEGASLWDNLGMAGVEDKSGKSENKLLKKLFGLGGEERYQLWPEKVVREGLTGAGDVMQSGSNLGLRREDITDIPPPDMPTKDSTWLGKKLGIAPVAASPQDDIIEKAQAISALAGSGGLGGTGAEAGVALGSGPSLRPALKYKDRLYKGKEGQQHQDIIPKELYPEFERMAMSGEDISHYNFGFVNDKGQFLTREKALEYGINTGLIDPHAGKYGALTSTLMADSSKPGTAIEATAKANAAKKVIIDKLGDDYDVRLTPSTISEGGFEAAVFPKNIEGLTEYVPRTGKSDVAYYDPKMAELEVHDKGVQYIERQSPRLKKDSGYSETIEPLPDKDVIYRGMSAGEYREFLKTGQIKSKGDYNLSGQQGLTYWATGPDTAMTYSNSYAPHKYQARPDAPAYVVATKLPKEVVNVPGTGSNEVGVSRAISKDEVLGVWEGKPYSVPPSNISIREQGDGSFREGSSFRSAPSLGWKNITLKADSSKPGTAIEAVAKTANPRKYMEVKKAIDDSDPNYVYHITNSERADLIANEGLKLHKPNEFTDQSVWPDGSRDKRNYFTPTAKNSWQFAPEEGKPALLRIKKDSHEFKNERTGDIYSKKPVPADKIEYLNDEGKWVSLKADSSKEGAALQANKPTFYSAVEHNVNAIPQSKMTGDQWLGTLSNKPGVKGEELDWTGLKGFLEDNKGKPVTKEQIQEHLAANKVELKEVSKGGDVQNITVAQAKQLAAEGKPFHAVEKANPERVASVTNDKGQILPWAENNSDKFIFRPGSFEDAVNLKGSSTKYHSYQLPGESSNYREVLLTLPRKEITTNDVSQKLFKRDMKNLDESERQAVSDEMRRLHETKADGTDYRSSHWDEPNILAHVRMNDRWMDDPSSRSNVHPGKVKSLHLEEIQSDWHQQGRDKGYDTKEFKAKKDELINKIEDFKKAKDDKEKEVWLRETKGKHNSSGSFANSINPDGSATHIKAADEFNRIGNLAASEIKPIHEKMLEASREYNSFNQSSGGVPDAPFKKSWHELALKRMIREAAEKGYDRLSWTPGEAQAARYDLSRSVDKIAVPMVNPNGTRSVRIDAKNDTPFKLMIDKDGKVDGMGSANQFSGKPLSDVVGKEMAEKIMKLDKPHEFSGEGLKIGGEGMKGFYDQIIPKALEKLGKEHGVKVKQERINKPEFSVSPKRLPDGREVYDVKVYGKLYSSFHTKEEAMAVAAKAEKEKKGTIVHYIDISPSLRDTAMKKGFPLFSAGGYMLAPVDYIPDFGDKK